MHYLFSDWPKAHNKFSKSVPGDIIIMSRMLKVMGSHVIYDCSA